MANLSIPFSQYLFRDSLDAQLAPIPGEVIPGVSMIKRYKDILTGKEYTGVYCSYINHLFLTDGSPVGIGLMPVTCLRFIPFPEQKTIVWNIFRNGSSSILRTRAALDGVELGGGEPSTCHNAWDHKYELLFNESYSIDQYKDYKHVAFVQNGERRFIRLLDYWCRTGPAGWYMYSWLPERKINIKAQDVLAKCEWILACAYVNQFSQIYSNEPHTWPQYKFIESMFKLDEVVALDDMDDYFRNEMGIECKHANRESTESVVTEDMLPDEWKLVIKSIYAKDADIKIGTYTEEKEKEDDEWI